MKLRMVVVSTSAGICNSTFRVNVTVDIVSVRTGEVVMVCKT